MFEMLREKDLLNDLKALASWLWSILFDLSLLGSASGLLSFVASFLGVIYLYHRIVKIKIEVKDAILSRKIKEITLEDLIEKNDKKVEN